MLYLFKEHKVIKENIAQLLNVSGYKSDYIAKKIGVNSRNFAVKKKCGNWNADELEKIVDMLTKPNEDAENALMLALMRSRKNDGTVALAELKEEFALK